MRQFQTQRRSRGRRLLVWLRAVAHISIIYVFTVSPRSLKTSGPVLLSWLFYLWKLLILNDYLWSTFNNFFERIDKEIIISATGWYHLRGECIIKDSGKDVKCPEITVSRALIIIYSYFKMAKIAHGDCTQCLKLSHCLDDDISQRPCGPSIYWQPSSDTDSRRRLSEIISWW